VAAIGQFAAVHSQRTLREAVRAGWEAVAAETMDKIDRCIQRRIEDLQVYARVQRLQEALAESNERFDRMADPLGHIHELDEKWMASPEHVLSPWMHALLDAGLSETLRKEVEIEDFYRRQYGYTLFGEVFVTNKHGANVAQTGWTSDYYQADEAWWHRARERGTYVGDIAYDESARILSLELAVAVTDARGDFAGVLKAVWNVKEIFGILARVRDASEHRSTTLDLLSDDGQVLHHVGPLAMSEGSGITKEGIVRIPDGTRAFVVHAPSRGYRDFEGLPWTLRMGYDAAEILAPAAGLQTVLLAFSAVVAAAALLGGLLLARHIARPIVALTETAKAVSHDKDYSVRAAPVSHGEMRTLVDAFNTMLGRIQQHERQLREQQATETQRIESELAKVRDELVRKTRLAALGQVSASIAHDLRNPLGAVRNAAYLLKRRLGAEQPGLRDHVAIIEQEVTKADRIITNLLNMTRTRPPNKEPVDLAALAQAAWKRCVYPDAVRFRIELPEEPFLIQADPDQFSQVLSNLIGNAADAVGGDGECVVEALREPQSDVLIVRDTGPGWPEETRERLFEPLVTTKTSGTGLGLAICRQIVESHGGTIEALDGAGQGAAVRIRLPRS
jgi:signal transduction histidine kinase